MVRISRLLILSILFIGLFISSGFTEDYKIQVRIKEQTPYGEYNDALYFTQDEFKNITQAQIDTLKQERVNNWLQSVTNPPPYIEPSKEDYQRLYNDRMQEAEQYLQTYSEKATKEELETIKVELVSLINELQNKIDAKPKTIEK